MFYFILYLIENVSLHIRKYLRNHQHSATFRLHLISKLEVRSYLREPIEYLQYIYFPMNHDIIQVLIWCRNYYRCNVKECSVKKRIERSTIDPTLVVTTYQGIHNHYRRDQYPYVSNGWSREFHHQGNHVSIYYEEYNSIEYSHILQPSLF